MGSTSSEKYIDKWNPFVFLHGREIAGLSESERIAYEEAGFRYWREQGFPFPTLSRQELMRQYQMFAESKAPIFQKNRILGWSSLGLSVANSFHPEMWSTKCEHYRTPIDVFNHDGMLRECIRRAVRFWKDRRPLSPPNLRRSVATFSSTKRVSNFRPTVARALVERYSDEGAVIIDPSAGYGGRLVGVLPLRRTYIGIEPHTRAQENNKALLQALVSTSQLDGRLLNNCAEDALPCLKACSADVVLFSPPYFRRERYSDEITQSWVRYTTYEHWKTNFLFFVLEQCHRVLRPGGYLILNVANTPSRPIANDARTIALKLFRSYYSYKMLIGSVPYHQNRLRGGFRHEPIIIFQKRR